MNALYVWSTGVSWWLFILFDSRSYIEDVPVHPNTIFLIIGHETKYFRRHNYN